MKTFVLRKHLLFGEKQLRSYTWKTKNVSDESEDKSKLWYIAYENDFVYKMEFSNFNEYSNLSKFCIKNES